MTIHHGDCIEVMATMPADSVDAIVTDPPYGLEFMGKGWDKFGAVVEYPDDGEGPWGRTSRVRYSAGHTFQAWCQEWGTAALRVTKPGGYLLAFGGTRTHHRLVCGLEDAGWIIRDELDWIYASGFPKGKANLKPAHEPIVLARKPGPLRPLNIEESRIGTEATIRRNNGGTGNPEYWRTGSGEAYTAGSPAGRWPSNVLLSDSELFDEPNPWVVGSGATVSSGKMMPTETTPNTIFGRGGSYTTIETYGDTGGYSRFFIVPKSDRADREPKVQAHTDSCIADMAFSRGCICGAAADRTNTHPTVKPVDLMRHLIRLVTPSGGTILDPFLGSGTTAIAAELEGFPWIGIEKESEYVAIAEARLNGTQRGLGLDVPAPTRRDIGKQRGNRDSTGRPTLKSRRTRDTSGYGGGWGSTDPDGNPIEEPAA